MKKAANGGGHKWALNASGRLRNFANGDLARNPVLLGVYALN